MNFTKVIYEIFYLLFLVQKDILLISGYRKITKISKDQGIPDRSTKFYKISFRLFYKVLLKITKGNDSAKKVGGVTVVNLCTSSSHALYFYQVL